MTVNQILSITIIMLLSLSATAQQIRATARIDNPEILIGDQTHLYIEVIYPKGESVVWQEPTDTFTSHIEIVSRTNDTLPAMEGAYDTLIRKFTVTSFDSGYWEIPPMTFSLLKNQSLKSETNVLFLAVKTLAVDTAQAIKDIKLPLDIPFSLGELVPYITIILGVALLITIILWLLRKYRKKPEEKIVIKAPERPPHEIALENLRKLEEKKLWQQNEVKQYYTELTDILRIYIEKRYGINAMELPSGDILNGTRHLIESEISKEKLKQALILADLVKFAKAKPVASEHELSIKNVVDFVKETSP